MQESLKFEKWLTARFVTSLNNKPTPAKHGGITSTPPAETNGTNGDATTQEPVVATFVGMISGVCALADECNVGGCVGRDDDSYVHCIIRVRDMRHTVHPCPCVACSLPRLFHSLHGDLRTART